MLVCMFRIVFCTRHFINRVVDRDSPAITLGLNVCFVSLSCRLIEARWGQMAVVNALGA